LKSVGVERDKRESLVNITFINPGTNKRLKDAPSVYINRSNIAASELEKQIVPASNLKLENYDAFVESRSEMIAHNASRCIKSLFPQLYRN
jgi:hypothetical protein